MGRIKKPAAPLRAWVPFGVTSALSLLIGTAMWIWHANALIMAAACLVLVCTGMGIDFLREHGARPLHVAGVVIGLCIGQFPMIVGFLWILAVSLRP